MSTAGKLFIAALLVAASTVGFWEYFSRAPAAAPAAKPAAPRAPRPYVTLTNPTAAKYIAPPDRSIEMQIYDKVVLYLMDIQEPDGHFDSVKAGASAEFCNLNGDIANTAVAAWVLMGASSAATPNAEAVARARKAVRWLETHLRPDGVVADMDGPGEPVVAQMFAGDTFRVAAAYSTRDILRKTTNKLVSASLLKTTSKNGGYGSTPGSDEPRADMLALGSFVYKYASLDGVKFKESLTEPLKPKSSVNRAMAMAAAGMIPALVLLAALLRSVTRQRKFSFSLAWLMAFCFACAIVTWGVTRWIEAAKEWRQYEAAKTAYDASIAEPPVTAGATAGAQAAKAAQAVEDAIVANLRSGMTRLDSKAHQSGTVFASTPGGPPDWRATVGGLQAAFLIHPSKSAVTPALEFIFGELDKKTESYPQIAQKLNWGKEGEGYDTITMWQGSISVVYMFTDDKIQFKSWTKNVRDILGTHQTPEGSWPVAGEDAKRGRVWRACLSAMTLILIAPPPPPPAPPPDGPANTPPAPPIPSPKPPDTRPK